MATTRRDGAGLKAIGVRIDEATQARLDALQRRYPAPQPSTSALVLAALVEGLDALERQFGDDDKPAKARRSKARTTSA